MRDKAQVFVSCTSPVVSVLVLPDSPKYITAVRTVERIKIASVQITTIFAISWCFFIRKKDKKMN